MITFLYTHSVGLVCRSTSSLHWKPDAVRKQMLHRGESYKPLLIRMSKMALLSVAIEPTNGRTAWHDVHRHALPVVICFKTLAPTKAKVNTTMLYICVEFELMGLRESESTYTRKTEPRVLARP